MSSSVHVYNKGKDPTQGLAEHSFTAEKMYSINFTDHKEKYCLRLHCNGANNYLFVNCTDLLNLKQTIQKL